ncbi:TPA: antireceptor, partial [Streptococcus suis]|nr:antireceptor [Streptococcus suis]
DNATGGGFSQTDQTKAYIGMYQDFTATDSTNPSSYRWTKWKGSDGAQGVPGPKGADGRTPYIHFAYSDNADGTGLTTSDNGQRYMGHYSDYTQADSTDKTKYRWADRWAKIEVGGRNYLRNGNFASDGQYWSEVRDGFTELSFNYDHSRKNRQKSGVHFWHSLTNTSQWYGIQQKFSFSASKGAKVCLSMLAAKDAGTSGLRVALHYIKQNAIVGQDWKLITNAELKREYQKFSFIFTIPSDVDSLNVMIYGEVGKTANLYATEVQLESGTVATDFTLSLEDINAQIDSKADQTLT